MVRTTKNICVRDSKRRKAQRTGRCATKETRNACRASDVFVPSNWDQSSKGLFIEFKSPKGRIEPTQKLFESMVRERGYVYVVFRDAYEAINYTLRFLGRPERLQNIQTKEMT